MAKIKKSSKKASKKPVKQVVKKNPAIKKIDKSLPFFIAIALVIILAIVVVFISVRKKSVRITPVGSVAELTEKLNVKLKEPMDAYQTTYGIENGDIARISYEKEVSDGYTMRFVLKSSSATENLVEYDNDFGSIAILMTVICDDGSEVEVTSFVATDDDYIMKSEWYDNDLYYAMTTDSLTTREDFLQEVNRVIIDNHVSF